MEPQRSERPRRGVLGVFAALRDRRDAMNSDEEPVLAPAVDRLQPWSLLAVAQGAYYAVFGAWPLFHLRSFEKVTGPKREEWLTKGVGACWLNVGIHLIQAGLRGGRSRRDVRGLAVRMAMTFAAFDFYYAGLRRRISPVYLVNGFVQVGFAALWGAERLAEGRAERRPPVAAHA
jgi:hypothetical protein